jgi:hypothetical protein
MSRPYFTLVSRDNINADWTIEFGDYDRETVQSELDDYCDHDYPAANLKIIRTADARQSTIDAAVAALNAR